MANRKILVDTSILIDFLRKKNKEKSSLWKLKEKYNDLTISSISVFELYAGATDNKKLADVKTILKWFDIIDFNEEIAEMSGEVFIKLKKNNKLIDYRDLFIGVSALFYNLKLSTLNIQHFDKIPELELMPKF